MKRENARSEVSLSACSAHSMAGWKFRQVRKNDLVVNRGDPCSKGHEFKSQHHIVDRHFSYTYFL